MLILILLKKVYEKVVSFGKKATLVECNVLYKGKRTERESHVEVAKKHGFDFAPIDILDGEIGEDEIKVTVGKDIVKLGKGLERYKNLLVLSHFKGHMLTSFGGAIKNIGMGLGSRAGKLDMHSGIAPIVHEEKCIACGICVENCDVSAIKINGKAKINKEKCVGCAKCIAVCPENAIGINWRGRSRNKVMEKIAKYAKGVLERRNVWCINFLNNITYNCDCFSGKQEPFMEDIGILMSKDCVGLDKACLDLVKKQTPVLYQPVFETNIFGELAKKYGRESISFWRNKQQKEIDFVSNYQKPIFGI